jgi:hypothetical protein
MERVGESETREDRRRSCNQLLEVKLTEAPDEGP